VPRPTRSYIAYVDDSGSENVGWLWTALVLPIDLWTEYLGRWLSFRRWLYRQYGVPAEFELHAQVWLSVEPARQTLRRSSDSQLLQMADCCAHAAFQSVQNKASLDEKFRRQYETTMSRLIARPFDIERGRSIRGLDYQGDSTNCPSERIRPNP